MNLENLKDRSVLLFGKPRALGGDEFDRLLKTAGIRRADTFEDGVLVVEGRMVNPVEQETLDRLYAEKGILPVGIDAFEKALCSQIDPDRIMMSLRLGGDRDRLRAFLQNPHIDDGFFLRLLALYDWNGEGFFDTDENRDVTAALIERFYENIERNHNVQYATLGLLHLLNQSDDAALVQTVGSLAPVRQALRSDDRQMRGVLETLAAHPAADTRTLGLFLRHGDDGLRTVVALRDGLDPAMQKALYDLRRRPLLEALAHNPSLIPELVETFAADEALAPVMWQHLRLDDARFEQAVKTHAAVLAANETLTETMQRTLLETGDTQTLVILAANPKLVRAEALAGLGIPAVDEALAANPATPAALLRKLGETGRYATALAKNPATPPELLRRLYETGGHDTLLALAANESAPVDILQQLQIDSRYERTVKMNDAFAAHIKREQIGWL